MNIGIKSLKQQSLLVEQEVPLIKDGLATVKVIQTTDKSTYKVGQKLLVNKGYLQELVIDGNIIFNTYHTQEDRVFAEL